MRTLARITHTFQRVGLIALLAHGLVLDAFAAKAKGRRKWHVPNASVRFYLAIQSRPSDPRAGIIAILPDGGILPKSVPRPIVVDKAQKTLPSQVLWHNREEGLGVVFAPPEDPAMKTVQVYLTSGTKSQARTGKLNFKPSILYYWALAEDGQELTLKEAHRLARSLPPLEKHIHMGVVPRIGQRFNPFGPDDHYTAYYRGYLTITQAGRYYLATISDDGSEFAVDGEVVASWPGLHPRTEGARGGYGKWLKLHVGTHLVEYFFFERTEWQEAHLLWRPPGHPEDQVPVTVPDSAYLRSGEAHVGLGQKRDGGPIASIKSTPLGYVWLDDRPINLFQLQAQHLGPRKKGTECEWKIDRCGPFKRSELQWLVVGNAPTDVALKVTWRNKDSSCRVPLYWDRTPRRLSLNKPKDRRLLSAALRGMHEMAGNSERTRVWQPELWGLLLRLIDPYADLDFLVDVVRTNRKQLLAAQPEHRWRLEDMLYEALRLKDGRKAAEWLYRFRKDAESDARVVELGLTETERLLYDEHDIDGARRVLVAMQSKRDVCPPATQIRFLIREGDVARLAGNMEDAAACYATAQEKHRKNKRGARTAEWRGSTVRGVACYDQFRNLLANATPLEARALLRKWELEFPLHKLTGIFPIAEAEYYVKIGDLRRAATLLKAYRTVTEVSNYLTTAFEMELDCLTKLDRNSELLATARDIVKRYPTHEIANKARRILGKAPAGSAKDRR